MGCNSSINIQTKEDKDYRIIKVNENKENIENNENNQDNGEYLDIESVKKTENGNTDCKTIINNNISNIHNMNINKNLYNYKSTNFKYLKDEQKSLHKSNPILKDNKKEMSYNNTDFIALKHPLDNSSEDNEKQENQITNKKEKINVTASMEERINNYRNGLNEQIEEDAVNMGNFQDDENDDMCNLEKSMNMEKTVQNNNNVDKNISVIVEIK